MDVQKMIDNRYRDYTNWRWWWAWAKFVMFVTFFYIVGEASLMVLNPANPLTKAIYELSVTGASILLARKLVREK